jgi:hypothetical protein
VNAGAETAEPPPAAAAIEPHLQLSHRRRVLDPLFRRGLLALLAVVAVLALLDVFGQRPVTSSARGAAAAVRVQAPDELRGGLIFQARFTVDARRALRHPTLVLGAGWFESMSVNSIVPQPTDQVTRGGRVRLTYPRMAAGDSLRVWIYFQVNPTNVGSRAEDVELDDGSARLVRIRRHVRVWP